MCTCPDGYIGQFCESCAPGSRHEPTSGGPFSPCVPCNCHGHASICDADTGKNNGFRLRGWVKPPLVVVRFATNGRITFVRVFPQAGAFVSTTRRAKTATGAPKVTTVTRCKGPRTIADYVRARTKGAACWSARTPSFVWNAPKDTEVTAIALRGVAPITVTFATSFKIGGVGNLNIYINYITTLPKRTNMTSVYV